MKRIPLHGSDGKMAFATVDDDDYEIVMQYRWHVNGQGYAQRNLKIGNKWTQETMHRFLMKPKRHEDVDHRDLLKTNNIRSNMRVCSRSSNCMNRPRQPNNTSGHKGVYFIPKSGRFRAIITAFKKRFHLGYFATFKQAVKAYRSAAIEMHGEFARW